MFINNFCLVLFVTRNEPLSFYWVDNSDYLIVTLTGFARPAWVFLQEEIILKWILGETLDSLESFFVDRLKEQVLFWGEVVFKELDGFYLI